MPPPGEVRRPIWARPLSKRRGDANNRQTAIAEAISTSATSDRCVRGGAGCAGSHSSRGDLVGDPLAAPESNRASRGLHNATGLAGEGTGVFDSNAHPVVQLRVYCGGTAMTADLRPITAACTGLVLRRRRLVQRGVGTLILGLATTCALAAVVAAFLDLIDRLPQGFALQEIPASQTHVNATTILVALAAGAAGMLAVETRASSAVGVAISVTTIPAAAYLGVAAGIGELGKAWSALGVLSANVAMMVTAGSITLATQRLVSQRRAS